MRELEKSDQNSKSLLANVLDSEGDFILAPGGKPITQPLSGSNANWDLGSNPRPLISEDFRRYPGEPAAQENEDLVEKELHSILLEIRVITEKIKDEVSRNWINVYPTKYNIFIVHFLKFNTIVVALHCPNMKIDIYFICTY